MESKPFFYSKTFWFNILTAAWFFIGPAVGIPELSPELFGTILSVGNVLLRFVTKQEVTIS